jgi:hypothetical protein
MRHSTAALLLACLLAAATAAAADDSNTKADPAHWGKPWDPPGGGSYSSNMYVAKLRGDGTRASAHMTLVVDEAAGTASYSLMMYNVNGYIMSHIHVVSMRGLNVKAHADADLIALCCKCGQMQMLAGMCCTGIEQNVFSGL